MAPAPAIGHFFRPAPSEERVLVLLRLLQNERRVELAETSIRRA